MDSDGKWVLKSGYSGNSYCLCQADIVITREEGLVRLEFKNEQLKFFPFNVTFKGKALDTQKNDSLKKDGKAKALSSTGILRTATEIN